MALIPAEISDQSIARNGKHLANDRVLTCFFSIGWLVQVLDGSAENNAGQQVCRRAQSNTIDVIKVLKSIDLFVENRGLGGALINPFAISAG
jgi:hypothetical protein